MDVKLPRRIRATLTLQRNRGHCFQQSFRGQLQRGLYSLHHPDHRYRSASGAFEESLLATPQYTSYSSISILSCVGTLSTISSITNHDWSQHSKVESLYNKELSCPAAAWPDPSTKERRQRFQIEF